MKYEHRNRMDKGYGWFTTAGADGAKTKHPKLQTNNRRAAALRARRLSSLAQ